MHRPLLPPDEDARLAQLRALGALDMPGDATLDQVVKLAAGLANTPMAAITLVATDRQVFKASVGIAVNGTARDISFCGHVVADNASVIVADTLLDERFHDNPLVTDAPGLRFYAGFPLRGSSGHAYGALCVLDTVRRDLGTAQRQSLERLATLATEWLEHRGRL
jgi:diguanylate cyclase